MLKIKFISGFLLLFLFSCTSPQSTAKDYLVAMKNAQFETAIGLVTEESKPILYAIILDKNFNYKDLKVEINECASLNQNDNEITCVYTFTHVETNTVIERQTIQVVRENNLWKVDLTNL